MISFNPFYYISIPFTYLWNLLKESDTQRGKVVSLIAGTLLLLLGIWVLWQWNRIPKYYHDLYIDRICSKDSFDVKQTSMSFQLKIDNGLSHSNEPYNMISETFSFRTQIPPYEKKKVSNYIFVKKRPFLDDYKDIIGEDNMISLKKEFGESETNIDDFDYVFWVCHRFSKKDADFPSFQNLQLRTDYSVRPFFPVKFLKIWGTNSDSLINTPFVIKNYPDILNNKNHYNYTTCYFFTTDGASDLSISTKSKSIDHSKVINEVLNFFDLRDISKAFYSFKFHDITIDSLDYTISFNEAVKFSNSSVDPEKTTLNSISFNEKPYKDIAFSKGVNFYVEFIETSNTQNIRIILLTALLALPLGMIVKNGWAYIIGRKKPQSNKKRKNKKKSK